MEPKSSQKSNNWISIYTTFRILQQMKSQLGLEAMLEYIDQYQRMIETHNPKFKVIIERAFNMMSVEKLYKDAMQWKEPA